MTKLTLLAFFGGLLAAQSSPVEFSPHVIEAKIPGGYSVIVADINHDGKPDVLGMTSRIQELAWYENPSWERHVLASGLNGLVNLAAYDADGDGIPEIALQNEFSMIAAKSPGHVWIYRHDGDPRKPWKGSKVDELITSHHVAWADVDGDGRKELINAPLIGAKALAPKYEDNVSLVFYPVPKDLSGEWKRTLIDNKLYGVLHRARVVKWVPGKRDQLLATGFDGIVLFQSAGSGAKLHWEKTLLSKGHQEEAPRAGASDVAMGKIRNRRILASVEPWHGNEVVVYTHEDAAGSWQRKVIFNELVEGHEVAVGDFNGDGRDDIVAGDRARGQVSTSHVFYAQDDAGAKWQHVELDHLGMSASGCAVADINGDGKPDIVQIGGATANIKWYENLGRKTVIP